MVPIDLLPCSPSSPAASVGAAPATADVITPPCPLPRSKATCPRGALLSTLRPALRPFPGSDDSTVLEIEVKAHRRLVHRKRYRPPCTCGVHPGIVTAPPPPRLIPKSPFGVSLWVSVLLDKYLFYRPTQRLLADWRSHGLDLASGSL